VVFNWGSAEHKGSTKTPAEIVEKHCSNNTVTSNIGYSVVMDDSEISILESIRFFEKSSISNYERFLRTIKDLSDTCAQWLVWLV